MATIKFKESSPYTRPTPAPPSEDYLYKIFENNRALTSDTASDPIIRIAIFGVGRAGMIHLDNIINNPRTKLIYIVDDMESNWPKIKKHFRLNDVIFLNSKQSDKVFKDPNVDAVLVASPTHTHELIVTKALEAKKSVFCEKPVAENRQNTEKCYATAQKTGKTLFTAFNRRFDPSYNAVRNRVRKGEVGHVHVLRIVSRDSPLPTIEYLRESGGIFHDCMVHDIDMMTWILGEYPTRVSVQASANIPEINAINDFDTVVTSLKFPSGTLGVIDLSRNSVYGYDMRLEAFGPKGMVRAENEQPIHCVETMYNYNGPNQPPIWYSFPSRFRLAYQKELDHFLDIILGKVEPSVKPKETLAVSKIAAACEESARTGKMIEIHWNNGELPA
ncbi:myo-inositol 2-dehydrogenase-like [Chelonus insularis]|uniref:myo-inositol 2-dehydrogenase-like n=1 Tax=Chelonus insularis TaxID=460826 RepID=UPI00158F0E36|nr:myo-inositol 2-dehydrogenase-like [Chelonus insularis]